MKYAEKSYSTERSLVSLLKSVQNIYQLPKYHRCELKSFTNPVEESLFVMVPQDRTR